MLSPALDLMALLPDNDEHYVKEAVNRYFEALADDIASGDWVDLPGIGKIQVIQEEANGELTSFVKDGKHIKRRVTHRLRTKVRLYKTF